MIGSFKLTALFFCFSPSNQSVNNNDTQLSTTVLGALCVAIIGSATVAILILQLYFFHGVTKCE